MGLFLFSKNKRVLLSGLFITIGIFNLAHADEELPPIETSRIQRVLPGKRSAEALHMMLRTVAFGRMLEKFQPVSTAMEWKLQSIEAQSDAFLVKAHVSKISNLKKEDSAVKSSSLWGYFSNAASHVSEYASSWISGDFVGLASSKIIQCQGPKALPGYLLDINLDQSSYVISSQAKAVQIEVCWETNSKKLLTEISLVLRVLPGFYSSVTATPEVLSQLQVQLEAWADFLSDQVAVEEVKLVQADYAVE